MISVSGHYFRVGRWRIPTLLTVALSLLTLATSAMASSDSASQTGSPSTLTVNLYRSLVPQSGQDAVPHISLQYSQPVRLSQILDDSLTNLGKLPVATSDNGIYWTGAALFSLLRHPGQAELARQFALLSVQRAKSADASLLASMALWLEEQPIGKRLFLPLDIDAVRIVSDNNPLLRGNDFNTPLNLVLPARPDHVWVIGAVDTVGKQPWQERKNARDYLQLAGISPAGNNSIATVIQPDGKVEQHPIAYWNTNHRDIAPGAAIYLEFDDLPAGFTHLNDEVVDLLRNRAL